MAKFIGKTGPFDGVDLILDQSRPREYWSYFKYTVPELSEAALALLSINPTEAACERSFSHHKVVHRPSRNRLSNANIKAEMMIRMNQPVLDGILVDPDACVMFDS